MNDLGRNNQDKLIAPMVHDLGNKMVQDGIFNLTGAVKSAKPTTSENLLATLTELENRLKPKDEWIIIDPIGVAYKLTYKQALRMLVEANPIASTPLNPFKYTGA